MTHSLKHAGDRYHEFLLKESLYIEELQCTLKCIEHEPSGAEIIHIENDDIENVFCLAFRTLPENSNGVAHILEHTVLCGSKRFPVKDPFFSMSRRSLNTYMNALTAPDFTCYPAASQVEKDFYNLLEVYLDAVFHPELKEMSFLQEGHRLEFSQFEDRQSPLEYKGIVFNEMKGALTSPISRLWQTIMSSLFPNLLYQYNFGGDPKEIPSLSYEELLNFHTKFYQKARCTFYFYGNFPTEKHLDFLMAHGLKEAKKLPPLPYNPIQPPLKNIGEITEPYPIGPHEDPENKTYIALSWLTVPLSNQIDVLALHILDLILMGTDAAPLKYKILRSNLCQNVFSNFEDELSQIPYSLIFEGCKNENLEPLKKLTYDTLKNIASKPIDPELIEGALHQLEFSRTEISGDYGPFGLSLILKLVPLKNVGAKLENSLKIHTLFERLRKDLKDPQYLQKLIHQYFLDNPHFSVIKMIPDKELTEKEDQQEKEKLDQLKKNLTQEESERLILKAKELHEFQNKQENQNLEVLPKVTLKDVSKEPRGLHLFEETIGKTKLFYHDCFTNEILYLDLSYELPSIELEKLPLVRLFNFLLPQVGANGRNYMDNLNLVQNHTGGISAFIDIHIPRDNLNGFTPRFFLQGKALYRKKEQLLNLIYDFATTPDFQDKGRIKELLSQHFVDLDQDLKQNSLRFANNLAYSGLCSHSYINYYWYGLAYYNYIKKIVRNINKELPALLEQLQEMKNRLLHGHQPHLILTCDRTLYNTLKNEQFGPLLQITEKPFTPFNRNFTPHRVPSQGRLSSAPVFFTAMAFKTDGFEDREISYLSIAAKLFDNTTLHKLIREQGGAYGGGSSNRMGSGQFSFYAYRDPNLATTLQAFHKSVENIAEGKFSERELEEAKLGILQKLDHPILPEYRAYTAYTWLQEKKTLAFRQETRSTILNATAQDIVRAVQTKILPEMKKAIVVTFGTKEKLQKENELLKNIGFSELELKSL